jgi:hypothetical protein
MTALLIPRALIAVETDALLVLKAQPLRLSVPRRAQSSNTTLLVALKKSRTRSNVCVSFAASQ